ncbi:MAG: GAF domain-containing protein [Bacteroidales bacterium]|nr:GAF domain-containing protein [Bacteroidales bacterium]
MMKKQTSNKKKIYLFALFPLLTAFIIILLAFFAITRINRLNQFLSVDDELNKQFVRIEELKNRLLFTYRFNTEPLSISDTEFEQELNEHRISFYSLLNEIQKQKFFSKNEMLTGISDSMKSTFQYQLDNLTQLHAMLKRKGTSNSGLIYELINLSRSVSDSSSMLEYPSLHKSIEDLMIAQNDFVTNADMVSSNLLTTYINILEGQFYLIEDESIRDKLIEVIHQYRNIARNIIELYERIGLQNNTSGILFEYSIIQQTSNNLFKRFDIYLQKKISQQKKLIIWLISALSIAFILSVAIWYVQHISKVISGPLGKILNYVNIIKSGILPEETLQLNTKDEFKLISENLNSIVAHLKEKTGFVKALNQGDLQAKLELSDKEDELGKELLDIQINTQKAAIERQKHDEESSKRRYINEGLAKFSEITHARYDQINNLTDAFIKELVKYLGSIQGGIFLMNDDTDQNELVLTSAFAYDRKKYLTKTVVVGEGLVGTCALEKKPVFLTEIPPDYISITSGLGDAPPNNILLLPMLQDDNVTGVIEIASLDIFQEHQIEFAKQVANNLSNTLSSAKINERTAKLLEQSQEHAQTMAEQEEEMRQNMEELRATQEESSRREEEFKGIADAMGKALFVAEFDLKGKLISINEKFIIFLGKKREQIIGKSFAEVVRSENAAKVDKAFLSSVEEGNHLIFNDVIKIGKKLEYKVQFHFSPELNRDEVPYKILCLGVEMNK